MNNDQFERIAQAIKYIQNNFKDQPNLEDIAKHIHLSPSHFQRLFSEWAGVSPKKFLQYISLEYAKKILKQNQHNSILDATFETGLSSTSRLHDLFIQIEGMTPAEYKNGGENLIINYQYAESIFGNVLIASTVKGICYLSFITSKREGLNDLSNKFPHARLIEQSDELQHNALALFSLEVNELSRIKLHLKGTDFQLKVWESLLKIPSGQLSTYARIAAEIENPKASRAVGSAIGSNPVAYLIPCHRVIQSTGILGDYHWGSARKAAIIAWEASKINQQ
ncbi:bifunctional transcriptional activator/DNA repair enzyme AdaA [Acinetobacter stercoris]|uniref:methylated-DNA--[protein]-cysteine S-methyltransferase n=1 Tax=Acinetobacter stercoris TaxID=2126983 RepID=A0A2U3MWI2_9GAMM|nr:methylated-DNA--[protein]-cysteine S-methyltransferase [Acinetobacter stercoris]SPL69792.1 Bifunctional transcriptional activator/DNA repair enzyme Ada [Acinetobacter stercoris]